MLPGEQQRMILWQGNAHRKRLLVQLIEHTLQLVLQPGMQDHIGRRQDAFGMHVSGRRAKERQQLGRSPTHVLVRLEGRLAFQMPVFSRLGNGLIGAGFVLAPQGQSCLFRPLVGLLDQLFFSPALGSCTVTVPALRTRMAVPVGHQVRVLPKR